ncbi:DNA replication factor Cdt1 [Culicoides brevitarsis]|uniref:DNA replication factor Cdt1 n=1 Tax=Culicoides brevitarsis TaxID=469753 RepID=UPI00307C8226
MSQQAISSYFATRKRGAVEDSRTSKAKVLVLDQTTASSPRVTRSSRATQKLTFDTNFEEQTESVTPKARKTRANGTKTPKSTTRAKKCLTAENCEAGMQQTKLVDFVIKGMLSPKKMQSPIKEAPQEETGAFGTKDLNDLNVERGMQTPVKQKVPSEPRPSTAKKQTVKDMPLNKIKAKLGKSDRLTELKTRLNNLQQGLDRLDRMESERKAIASPKKTIEITKEIANQPKSLKKFEKFEVEVISPRKEFTSPIKMQHTTPQKNALMTPTKGECKTPTRRLFSPSKNPLRSPPRVAAYNRFQHLVEAARPTLQLPYKYRYILDMFKTVDSICAMLHNRNEKITFKKLKPAVQRTIRKNFHETHLAQIKQLYPEAYKFHIEKTRNFGSETKHDTYQLVIVPNGVGEQKKDAPKSDNLVKNAELSAMNAEVLVKRQEIMQNILLELVKDEHEKFLATLDPPMRVDRKKLTRWHPEFDLEACPEVKRAELPQPPHEDRMTSAKDVLSTARNLFNCGTPMEKALERLQQKKAREEEVLATPLPEDPEPKKTEPVNKTTETLLKGVPNSLLEKIRQKQAAKALDQMTRRPSQEIEATKYSRLHELARVVHSTFVTEGKNVLVMEDVLKKVQNSFRESLNNKEIEEHLRLIEKEIPTWISFPCVRQKMYVKLTKNAKIQEIYVKLDKLAAAKSA